MTPYAVPHSASRSDNIALIFQEVLTAIVRLRSGRQQSPDAESFRYHMREAVKAAANEARNRAGYSSEDVRMSTLAVVGFLDESVLNSRNPLFAAWPSQPLQQEWFPGHTAGQVFFDNLNQLLARNESADLADVLELHSICMLLGFTGLYAGPRSGELQAIRQAVMDKIQRIRGSQGDLSPSGIPPQDVVVRPKAGSSRPWVIAAVICLVLALVLFVSFKLFLGTGVSDLQNLAAAKV